MAIKTVLSQSVTRYMVFLFAMLVAPGSFAINSMCFEYYSSGIRHMAHSMSYSAVESDQPEEADLGHQLIVSSPSYYVHQTTVPTSFGGGSHQTQVPTSGYGFYSWTGQGFTGMFVNPDFYVAHESVPCSGSFTISPPPPTAWVDINPNVVNVGEAVTIDWGSNGVDCEYEGGSIGPLGSHLFTAALTDAGTYTIYCVSALGVWASASDTLTVNDPGPDCPAVPTGTNQMIYPVNFGADPGSGRIGYFSRVGNPVITSEAYCTTTEWRLRVVDAQHTVRIDVNLSNLGNTQISAGDIMSANCSVLETMRSSLVDKAASVTASYGGWYDAGAVTAHEHVHRERYESLVDSLFTSVK